MTYTDGQVQELKEQKDRIYARIKEVQEVVRTTTSLDERLKQQDRLKILRDMYRDTCDQLEIARPPAEKKHKAPTRRKVSTDNLGYDFFERCGTVWSDLEGKTWNEFSEIVDTSSANQANALMDLLKSSMQSLTPTQYECITAYYVDHKTIPQIADERQVTKSTISRSIKNGLRRIETQITASLHVSTFLSEDGFDFMGFASATNVLTERQREMFYFLLTDQITIFQVAQYLSLTKSSISRTWGRICDNLSNVSSSLVDHPCARKINYLDWINRSEKEIAEELGISPATYYRNVCRNEMVGPLTRYAYEILRLRGHSAKEVSQFLGVHPSTVMKYWKKYANVDVESLPVPEPYIPRKVKEPTSNIRAMIMTARSQSSGNTIGDAIDGKTYRKLMELSSA